MVIVERESRKKIDVLILGFSHNFNDALYALIMWAYRIDLGSQLIHVLNYP